LNRNGLIGGTKRSVPIDNGYFPVTGTTWDTEYPDNSWGQDYLWSWGVEV